MNYTERWTQSLVFYLGEDIMVSFLSSLSESCKAYVRSSKKKKNPDIYTLWVLAKAEIFFF